MYMWHTMHRSTQCALTHTHRKQLRDTQESVYILLPRRKSIHEEKEHLRVQESLAVKSVCCPIMRLEFRHNYPHNSWGSLQLPVCPYTCTGKKERHLCCYLHTHTHVHAAPCSASPQTRQKWMAELYFKKKTVAIVNRKSLSWDDSGHFARFCALCMSFHPHSLSLILISWRLLILHLFLCFLLCTFQ